jgi:hypothetical protein
VVERRGERDGMTATITSVARSQRRGRAQLGKGEKEEWFHISGWVRGMERGECGYGRWL